MQDTSSISGTRPLRSRATTDGLDRAPHRAFLRAMGLSDEAIAQPFIGVVSTAGEITPCNLTLATQAAAAKAGVAKAGGTPREFTTISVSDGLSMNHQGMKFSLVSRELIADSIETVVRERTYAAGAVLIIRNEGPKGGPGMREMLEVTALSPGRCHP